MHFTEPAVTIISRPTVNWDGFDAYLSGIGGTDWSDRRLDDTFAQDGQDLIEGAGRICYRSWVPGLNPNVTKVREDQAEYLDNILKSGHGSVLEHANYTFVLHNVSRILTHELVRHRAGSAFSQESGRYIQITDVPIWFPKWVRDDPRAMEIIMHALIASEQAAWLLNEHYDTDHQPFHRKKVITSLIRRVLPGGIGNDIMWTANIRAIRHTLEVRTADGAEEEIRLVFDQIGQLMMKEAPLLFRDFTVTDSGAWVPTYKKV